MENKDIYGIGKDEEKLLVQKSKPLLELWKSELTLPEFKIMDLYLSRINSHEPDKRSVVMTKSDLEKCLGLVKINSSDLKKRLLNLMQNPVTLSDEENEEGFIIVNLFEEARLYKDKNDVWQVKLECTSKAMKYFFNIENLGYLRYRLKSITSITNKYSYIMFLYLENNRYRKTWEIRLEDLKEMLKCDKDSTYSEYKHFNNLILKKIHKELNDNTNCKYEYEAVRKGRKTHSIKFSLLSSACIEDDSFQPQAIEENATTENKPLWYKAVESLNFSNEQLKELSSLLPCIPTSNLPNVKGGTEQQLYHYMLNKISELNRRDANSVIKNKFSYMLKMIHNDTNSNNTGTSKKFNYEQRDYDDFNFEELEKKAIAKYLN